MIIRAEGMVVGHDDAFDLLLEIFQRHRADFRRIGGLRLLDCGGQQIDRVVALCCARGRRKASTGPKPIWSALGVDEGSAFRCDRRLDDE